MNGVLYRELEENEICMELFSRFIRHQTVVECVRKVDGKWVVRDDPFTDDWSEEEYEFLVKCLKNTAVTGGFVCGAFVNGQLKGFASVEAAVFGGENMYLDLTSLHVSEDMRRNGIGRELFEAARRWAKEHGGKKLYISAHSAVETQAFYRKMGCVEAAKYNPSHVAAEPFDCQLECAV